VGLGRGDTGVDGMREGEKEKEIEESMRNTSDRRESPKDSSELQID